MALLYNNKRKHGKPQNTNWPPPPAKTLSLSLTHTHTAHAYINILKPKDELSLKRTIGLTTITKAAAAMPSASAGRVTVPDWTMCAPRTGGYDWFQTDSLNLHRSRGMSRWTSRNSRKSFRICICQSMIRFQSGLWYSRRWGCGDCREQAATDVLFTTQAETPEICHNDRLPCAANARCLRQWINKIQPIPWQFVTDWQ